MPEERKLVTILFADVTGSTALADILDAEDVRALMSRYYDHARRVITPRGGTLEKFIGDAVMAIFGFSQAHEDDPERALSAALALRDAIASDEVLSPVFRLRIGVNTGEVVATNNPDRLDFLVTGDAVNVSARLQQGAQPGEIIVSERTAQATKQSFLFGEERVLQAKGKPHPLRVFPLEGQRVARQADRPPFVGRQNELRQMNELQERVMDEQRAQLLLITAPAGTGKSRLLEEFLAHPGVIDRFRIAFARCLPYGQTLTYWPLRGLLTELLGSVPEKEQVQAIFCKSGYQPEDATRLADLVLTVLGTEEDGENQPAQSMYPKKSGKVKKKLNVAESQNMLAGLAKLNAITDQINVDEWLKLAGLDELNELTASPNPDLERIQVLSKAVGERGKTLGDTIRASVYDTLREVLPSRYLATERESLLSAWRLFIEVLAQQAPRIIVFEDLHWASDALLELVEHIGHMRTHTPLLLVVLSRPELLDRRPTWMADRQHMTTLRLQPLGEHDIDELLKRMLVEIPEAIREQIAERSSGNPFFALELVRGYAERAQRGEITTIKTLPDTVHAAIQARIDLLSPQERALVQVASVANRTLRRDMLQALLDEQSEQGIDQALEGLCQRDMLREQEHEQYVFRHILIRDVAYSMLARSERIRLHSKIALWLEVHAGERLDEYIELIAYHYREAIQLSRQSAVPPKLPFKMTDAALLFERAGVLAGRSGSYAEARSNLQFAIELAPPSEHPRLYEALGESVPSGTTSFIAFQKALESWRAGSKKAPQDGARLIRKLLMEGTRNSVIPRFSSEEAEVLCQEGLTLAKAAGDIDEHWRLRLTACFDTRFYADARHPTLKARFDQQRSLAEQAVAYFEQRGHWEAVSEALDAYGILSVWSNALADALAAMKRRLTIPALPQSEWADAVSSVAFCLFLMGDYEACIAYVKEILAHLKPDQPLTGLGKAVSYGTLAAFLCGHWEEAEQWISTLDEIHELMLYDQLALAKLVQGYIAVLLIALAREDRPLIEALSTKIRQDALPFGSSFVSYLDALVAGTPQSLTLEPSSYMGHMLSIGLLLFMNENGQPLPAEVLAHMRDTGDGYQCWRAISYALADADDARLEHAIDEAEAHHLIHHAARMRVILAQRNGNLTLLERARPVLERLNDRQYLRRIEEVARIYSASRRD